MLYSEGSFLSGLWFSVPLMTILSCHELGHYLQMRRYRVYSTLPYFIPIPLPPFGTLGAVIQMDSRVPNIKALFDIGISGPLAGLVPTVIFLFIGLPLSTTQVYCSPNELVFGEPLLIQWLSALFFDRSTGEILHLHPIAMAAWTGIFLTSLNLFPLGQLDGGHIFYALLRHRAAPIATIIFMVIALLVIIFGQWNWCLMIILVLLMGISHPPTCNDSLPLGKPRMILGCLTLAFVLIGFTPFPVRSPRPEELPPPKPRSQSIYAQNEQSDSSFFVFRSEIIIDRLDFATLTAL